jgi:hypothetical protein
MFAIRELWYTLRAGWIEAWAAADVANRFKAWWWTVRHRDLLDGPAPREVADA